MTFALVESAGGFTATVPPLVVAGSPLFFVLSTSQLPASTLDTVRLRYRVERDDAAIWGTSDPYVRDAAGTEPRRRRSGTAAERTFRIDTLETWSGFLVVVIQPQQAEAAIVAPVQLVQANELFAVERELDIGLRERKARPDNPAEGDDEFSVPEVLREAGGYASEAADLLGPAIEVVVRPHQQSLAVWAASNAGHPQGSSGTPTR